MRKYTSATVACRISPPYAAQALATEVFLVEKLNALYMLSVIILDFSTIFNEKPSQRTRHPREIDFRLLRSVGAKNYGFVSSDARKEGEKMLPQGGKGRARPLGGCNLRFVSSDAREEADEKVLPQGV